MLIDTHCHLEDMAVVERARAAGVKRMINIGCDVDSSKQALAFCSNHADLFFTAGVHPHEASKAEPGYLEEFKILSQDPKCVGIGECGLDYYYDHSDRPTQRRVFEEQVALALELKKPLIIHVRDAHEDCLERLPKNHPTIIHCFSGTREHAKAFLDKGCTISISGIVTFKKAEEIQAAVIETPLERLLIETDSPYLAPVPYRGKPNEPAYVKFVADKIAELKNIPVEKVIEQTGQNALQIFWA